MNKLAKLTGINITLIRKREARASDAIIEKFLDCPDLMCKKLCRLRSISRKKISALVEKQHRIDAIDSNKRKQILDIFKVLSFKIIKHQ